MLKIFFLGCVILALSGFTSFSQENNWKWSVQSVSADNNSSDEIVIDDLNNSYFSGFYDTGNFQIGDSVFVCQEATMNSFVSSFDWDGNFRWAVDLHKLPEGQYGMVMDCHLATDSEQNLYVAGEFDFTVVLGDTVLNSYGNWDVFIAKYDSAGQFIWAYQVGGPTDDQVSDIKIDDLDNIYLSLNHSRPSFDNTVIYGNSDTSITFHNYCAAVLGLTTDASLVWLTFGTSEDGAEVGNLMVDVYENLYAEFVLYDDFMMNGQTIVADLEPITHALMHFNPYGIPDNYVKFPHHWMVDMLIDRDGNFIATGVFNSPIIMLGDTLVPVGFYDFLLVKYNHQMEPLWYITFPNDSYTIHFKMDLDYEDGIYISTEFIGEVMLGDTLIQTESPNSSIFIAKLDPSGDCTKATVVEGSGFQYVSDLKLDRCSNIMYCGGYNNEIYLGNDTLTAGGVTEVMLAKLSNQMGSLELLGNDTLIYISDTLYFSIDPGADNILWSDGSTASDFVFNAAIYGEGVHTVRVDINLYGCYYADSVNIQVIDNSFVDDPSKSTDLLYPNPASGSVQIRSTSWEVPGFVNFYNQYGVKVLSQVPDNNTLDVSGLKPGVYIVEMVFIGKIIRTKLLIL